MSTVVNVSLSARAYDIVIGERLLSDAAVWTPWVAGRACLLVTNDRVAGLHGKSVAEPLQAVAARYGEVVLPDGEAHKNWESLNRIHEKLLADRFDRKTVIVALGGGVIGDLAGFAAATYQRGIDLLQVPTTLLSQVDSSVGGKTGINHPLGKNMIGAFWQPRRVLIDTGTLATLPVREFNSGFAEIVKYGLIGDRAFFEWLEQSSARLMARDAAALAYAIEKSCQAKAAVVVDDEFEQRADNGRALLNLGHTFGHAIETGLGYGEWLHGEAVAAGTVIAARLSCALGWIDEATVARVERLLAAFGLPTRAPRFGSAKYLELMSRDKKNVAGRLRLVLLSQLGQARTYDAAPTELVCAAIEACGG